MFRTMLTTVFLAGAAATVSGGEQSTAPKGPPPQVMILQVERDGAQYLLHTTMTQVAQQVPEKYTVGKREFTRLRTVYVHVPRQVRVGLEGKNVQVFDATGKRLMGADIPKFLKAVPVLVSADGKAVDPFYLRLVRPDTLVIVAPVLAVRPMMPVPVAPAPQQNVPVPKT